MANRRYILMLDLKEDEALIAEYEHHHQQVWPEVLQRIKEAGIENMEIYRLINRLVMIMEVNEHFSFERKAAMDRDDPKVQEWEQLMWKYQQALPGALPGEKWKLMHKLFEL